MNPYEEAIKWVESEVLRNGVFKMERDETEIMEFNKPVMDVDGKIYIAEQCISMKPTGRFKGFTCSSQHTDGQDLNFLQLVTTMRRMAEKYNQ